MNQLGAIGFDRIKISGFIKSTHLDTPVLNHVCKSPESREKMNNMDNVIINKHKVVIKEKGFTLSWGNSPNGTAYCNLDIRSDPDGFNLHNLCVTDVRDRIEASLAFIHSKYSITFPEYDYNKLTVTYAEINRTLEINRPFDDYADFLDIFRYSFAGDDSPFMKCGHGTTLETDYLTENSSFFIKAYDKKAELVNKKPELSDLLKKYKGLFRLEITVKNESQLKTHRNCAYLCQMTDDFIGSYFRYKISKFEKGLEAWIKMGMHPYKIQQKGGSDKVIPSLVSLFMDCSSQKGIHDQLGYLKFFSKIYYTEKEILGRPYFTSIELLEEDLRKYLSQNPQLVTEAIRNLRDTCSNDPNYRSYLTRKDIIDEMYQYLLS